MEHLRPYINSRLESDNSWWYHGKPKARSLKIFPACLWQPRQNGKVNIFNAIWYYLLPCLLWGMIFCIQPAFLWAGEIQSMAQAASVIVKKLDDGLSVTPLSVQIKRLTLEDTPASSSFSLKFLTMVQAAMTHYPEDFIKIEYLENTPKNLSRGGITNVNSFVSQQTRETKATLEGQYRQIQDKVIVNLRLISSNGEKIADAEVAFPSTIIDVPLKPDNLKKIQNTEKDISSVFVSTENGFRIRLDTNKGNGATYQEGEEIKVYFQTEKDTYVKVLYVDAEGNRITLYPTEKDPVEKLAKGKVHDLTRRTRWQITCETTCGTEVLLAFASPYPLPTNEDLDFGGGLRGYHPKRKLRDLLRTLRGIQPQPSFSTTQIYLTTVPKL